MKRAKRNHDADPKLVRRLGLKLAMAAVIVGLAGIVSIWPDLPNAEANKIKVAKGLRTVIVLGAAETPTSDVVRVRQCRPWLECKNGQDGIDIVFLKMGRVPDRPIKAVVESDTDCAPDQSGNSHCSNRLRLANGESFEVRHDHDMQIYPCLMPGEAVELRSQRSI